MSARRACNHTRALSGKTTASPTACRGDRGQPVLPAVQSLGSRTARTGQGEQHATYSGPCESAMRNTGDASVDAQRSGEVVRGKRLTKARCERGASDGASESEPRQAGDTRMRTDGVGP